MGETGAVHALSTSDGKASPSAAFSRCNQTKPRLEVYIKRLQAFKKGVQKR